MGTTHRLRGFVGQSMAAKKRAIAGLVYAFSPGSYVFTPPKAGYWKFVAWGGGFGGGGTANAGDAGGYAEYTRFLSTAQSVAIVVGNGVVSPANTVLTFPDGRVVTAGTATSQGGAGVGVASGGDVNINGNPGTVSGNPGGAGPSNGPFIGGAGGPSSTSGQSPGGGGGSGSSLGSSGLVLALFVKP